MKYSLLPFLLTNANALFDNLSGIGSFFFLPLDLLGEASPLGVRKAGTEGKFQPFLCIFNALFEGFFRGFARIRKYLKKIQIAISVARFLLTLLLSLILLVKCIFSSLKSLSLLCIRRKYIREICSDCEK